jgi:hypothetical protein
MREVRFCVGTATGEVLLVDASSLQVIRRLFSFNPSREVVNVLLVGGWMFVAVRELDHTLKKMVGSVEVWNRESMSLQTTLRNATGSPVNAMGLVHNTFLVVSHVDSQLVVWDPKSPLTPVWIENFEGYSLKRLLPGDDDGVLFWGCTTHNVLQQWSVMDESESMIMRQSSSQLPMQQQQQQQQPELQQYNNLSQPQSHSSSQLSLEDFSIATTTSSSPSLSTDRLLSRTFSLDALPSSSSKSLL